MGGPPWPHPCHHAHLGAPNVFCSAHGLRSISVRNWKSQSVVDTAFLPEQPGSRASAGAFVWWPLSQAGTCCQSRTAAGRRCTVPPCESKRAVTHEPAKVLVFSCQGLFEFFIRVSMLFLNQSWVDCPLVCRKTFSAIIVYQMKGFSKSDKFSIFPLFWK